MPLRVPVRKKCRVANDGDRFRQVTVSRVLARGLLLLLLLSVPVHGGNRPARSYGKSKEDVPARPNAVWEDGQLEPSFDNSTERNVTTQLSKTAYLHCRVRHLGERSVSWIRQRDLHILTVGRYTYTTDQRFQAIHFDNTDDWTLQVKYPQKRDTGTYECQVSTEPKMSLFVHLTVVGNKRSKQTGRAPNRSQRPRHTDVASASIRGGPEKYIKSGSTINLTCDVAQSQQPQAYVFWYRNEQVINYDAPRGGVSVETTKSDVTTSRLLITNARPADSGNYTCQPSNADSASIIIHVLNGEKPGALQHGDQGGGASYHPAAALLSWLLPLLVLGVRWCAVR